MLSVFVGEDHEWVVWMPQGFYQTSVAGDRRYLGWHKNNVVLDRPTDTDHFAAEKFEKELRRPQVIQRLFATGGDLGLALQANDNPAIVPDALVASQGPPVMGITEPANRPVDRPLTVPAGAVVDIRARAAAEGRELVRAIPRDGQRPPGGTRSNLQSTRAAGRSQRSRCLFAKGDRKLWSKAKTFRARSEAKGLT